MDLEVEKTYTNEVVIKDGIHKCRNCIYDVNTSILMVRSTVICNCLIEINKYTNEYKNVYKSVNCNGKCPYFKKKWWLFFVKDNVVYGENEYLEHEKIEKEKKIKMYDETLAESSQKICEKLHRSEEKMVKDI